MAQFFTFCNQNVIMVGLNGTKKPKDGLNYFPICCLSRILPQRVINQILEHHKWPIRIIGSKMQHQVAHNSQDFDTTCSMKIHHSWQRSNAHMNHHVIMLVIFLSSRLYIISISYNHRQSVFNLFIQSKNMNLTKLSTKNHTCSWTLITQHE